MKDLSEAIVALRSWDSCLIACHVDPDPDCVGSMLALDWLCDRLGKRSRPLSHDPMLPQWRFLPRIERVTQAGAVGAWTEENWDALVVVDCEVDRTGDAASWAGRVRQVINIDHHLTNPGTGHVNVIRTHAAAAGEIVYDLIEQAGMELDTGAASLLYAAIMADTGSFRFSNTSARVFEVASHLVRAGALPDIIAREIYDTRSWSYVRLLGRVLETLRRSDDRLVSWITLTQAMITEEGARKDESEGFIQYPRMIDGVEIALIFRESGAGKIRVGFRSRERVDVSALAQEFGGGGHERAAGCTMEGSLSEVQAIILDRAIQVAGGVV